MSEHPRLPPRVARSEDELIKIARGLVGAGRPPPRSRASVPITQIGPTAMKLLQQTLARGAIGTLLRAGGWETRRTLVDGQPRRGRLWERHPTLPPLRFGPASFALLTWLHEQDLVRPSRELERDPDTTLGDELLHYLACEQLARANIDLRQPAFTRSPLCQLGFFGLLAKDEDSPLPEVDFSSLSSGPGAIVVEALQSSLARRWLAAERHKGGVVSLDEMTRLGRAQAQVLAAWCTALERAEPSLGLGRRDLASFLAEAARQLLGSGKHGHGPDYRWWIRSLTASAPLAARQRAFAAAAAFLRGLGRLGAWLEQAGIVAHFDEDYEAAQLLLSSWQYLRVRPPIPDQPVHGQPPTPASILERAAMIANTLESLHSLGAAEAAAPPELP
ncbi:MAG: hypothetical protein R6X02_34405 [Enhygromyxa sp.]